MNKNTVASATDTINTTVRLSALLSLSVLLSACDGRTSASPSPTPGGVTTPSSVTYTLYGGVWEETSDGPAPIEGARVRDESGRDVVTDAKGQFSISGLSPRNHTIWVTRSGYITETKTFTITSDMQLDIYVGRIQSYVLSGVVFEITEAGRIPIEGVELYCDSCGSPDGHTFVTTKADGFYRLEWTTNGVHPLLVTKAGYELFGSTGRSGDPFGRISATVRGDTVLDVQLVRR
jgi:Carboxypeptidase regulatory-like domain